MILELRVQIAGEKILELTVDYEFGLLIFDVFNFGVVQIKAPQQ